MFQNPLIVFCCFARAGGVLNDDRSVSLVHHGKSLIDKDHSITLRRVRRIQNKCVCREFDLQENVVFINRVAKVVKGGRRFSFAAVVVVGDGKGKVGAGLGKAAEVPEAIRKGVEDAKKNMITVALKNGTIPHPMLGIYGAGKVIMKPAAEGTGVKAGGPVRSVLAMAGIRNILTKSLGSSNPINMVRATMDGLAKLENVETVAALRGKSVEEIYN